MRYSPRRKLSVEDVVKIRRMRKAGYTRAFIAGHFNVSKSTLQMLFSGSTYKNVK